MKFGIGQSVPRSEDPRLITGGGQYTDDINRPNQLYIRILRSPYAHGLITELDISAALSRPGVEAVYTAEDLAGEEVRCESAILPAVIARVPADIKTNQPQGQCPSC